MEIIEGSLEQLRGLDDYGAERKLITGTILDTMPWREVEDGLFASFDARSIQQGKLRLPIGRGIKLYTGREWDEANQAAFADVAHFAVLTEKPAVGVFEKAAFERLPDSEGWELKPTIPSIGQACLKAFIWI